MFGETNRLSIAELTSNRSSALFEVKSQSEVSPERLQNNSKTSLKQSKQSDIVNNPRSSNFNTSRFETTRLHSVFTHFETLNSQHSHSIKNQINLLQRRLDRSYECLREAEQTKNAIERKLFRVQNENDILQGRIDKQIENTHRIVEIMSSTYSRRSDRELQLRTLYAWSRTASMLKKRRYTLCQKVADMFGKYRIAMMQYGFTVWSRQIRMADKETLFHARMNKIRTCFTRLWVYSVQCKHYFWLRGAFSQWHIAYEGEKGLLKFNHSPLHDNRFMIFTYA